MADGTLLWHRHDLRRVQSFALRDGKTFYCEADNRPTHKLDFETGRSVSSERAVTDINESLFAPIVFYSLSCSASPMMMPSGPRRKQSR